MDGLGFESLEDADRLGRRHDRFRREVHVGFLELLVEPVVFEGQVEEVLAVRLGERAFLELLLALLFLLAVFLGLTFRFLFPLRLFFVVFLVVLLFLVVVLLFLVVFLVVLLFPVVTPFFPIVIFLVIVPLFPIVVAGFLVVAESVSVEKIRIIVGLLLAVVA